MDFRLLHSLHSFAMTSVSPRTCPVTNFANLRLHINLVRGHSEGAQATEESN